MSIFRSVPISLWNKTIKGLGKDEKIIFLYLYLNKHSHYSGLYSISIPLIAHETDLTNDEVGKAIGSLVEKGLIGYDNSNEIIWIKDMLKIQYELKGGLTENQLKGICNHIESEDSSKLIDEFNLYYGYLLDKIKVGEK